MSEKHGPWTIEHSSVVHTDPFLTVRFDHVLRPDGRPGTYTTAAMKPGVAVLPVDHRGDAYLVRQFRYALGAEALEVPCGGIDPGEAPADAARRELREELGIEATRWTDLGAFDMDTSVVTAKVSLFIAHGLSFTEPDPDANEAVASVMIPFEQAFRHVMDGTITHGPSCVLILKARASGRL